MKQTRLQKHSGIWARSKTVALKDAPIFNVMIKKTQGDRGKIPECPGNKRRMGD